MKLWRNWQYDNHQPNISINFIDDVGSFPLQKYDNAERQYEVGDWVIYTGKYSEDYYPGEVMLVAENEVTVSVMYISGGQGYSSKGEGGGGIGGEFPRTCTWTCFLPTQ